MKRVTEIREESQEDNEGLSENLRYAGTTLFLLGLLSGATIGQLGGVYAYISIGLIVVGLCLASVGLVLID